MLICKTPFAVVIIMLTWAFNYNITRIVLCERVYSVAGLSLRASVSLHVSLSSGQLLLSFRTQLSGLQLLLTHAMHIMLKFLP